MTVKRTDGIHSHRVADIYEAVRAGSSPNECNGFPAIINHILDKHVSCVKALIDLGANVNVIVKLHSSMDHESDPIKNRIFNESTPLDFAMCNYCNNPKKYEKIIDMLIAAGAKNAHSECLVLAKPCKLDESSKYHTAWIDCTDNLLEGCEVYNILHKTNK